jgi:PD-(D/E)XK nuclease superfamily
MTVVWTGVPLLISNSEIQTWKACHRRWYLAYYRELGLRRDLQSAVGARQLGTRVHVALSALYVTGESPLQALQEVYAEDRAQIDSEDVLALEKLAKEYDLAHAMVEGYLQWIEETGADEGMTFVSSEEVIEVPSGVPGVRLRGKLDQRWKRNVDGARLFVDHKTVADFESHVRTLPLNEQMPFYHLLEYLDALAKTGDEPLERTDGALYNMLRKVKRTARATPPFYHRVEVRHNKEELRSAWIRSMAVIEEIVITRQKLDSGADHRYVAYRKASNDFLGCKGCDFLQVCSLFDDGSNAEGLLREYYVHLDPHERYAAQDEGKVVTQ